MEVSIEIVKGPEKGRRLNFNKPSNLLVGRSKIAVIKLSELDRYVSRKHCILEIVPPRCILHHFSSNNETLLNNQSVTERELSNNDVISIGYTSLKVGINRKIGAKNIRCIKCNCTIEVPENADGDFLCDSCSNKIKDPVTIPTKAVEYKCSKCGSDLSKCINTALLSGKEILTCLKCLPKREYLKGDMIGDYELIKFLNQGGMGAIYIVYHKETARMLVLKKIDGIAKDDLVVKHFIREINVHKSLLHKNIIRYIDSGIDNKFPYLIMEFANSADLEDLLENSKGKIPLRDSINYLIQSLEGLKFMHNKNLIHRDLKPGNILLHKRNNEYIIKLTDFGLSKLYKNAAGTVLTKVGDRKGSLLFMSPEQIQNTKDVDHRSDIYSLGVTFYYLMTTWMPFTFPSNFVRIQLAKKYEKRREKYYEELIKLGLKNNVINLVLTNEAIPIEKRLPDINNNIANIINNMIQHDLKKRYQCVEDILSDISKIKV